MSSPSSSRWSFTPSHAGRVSLSLKRAIEATSPKHSLSLRLSEGLRWLFPVFSCSQSLFRWKHLPGPNQIAVAECVQNWLTGLACPLLGLRQSLDCFPRSCTMSDWDGGAPRRHHCATVLVVLPRLMHYPSPVHLTGIPRLCEYVRFYGFWAL